MKIDTRVIPEFLSDAEIEIIEEQTKLLTIHTDEHDGPEKLWSSELQIMCVNNKFSDPIIESIIIPKVRQHFHTEIVINQAHILTSYIPYGIHTDARGSFGVPDETYMAAWTFIIPLDDYDSATIVFDQYGTETIFDPADCGEAFNWTRDNKINEETIDKYLSHQKNNNIVEWLSIQDIFHWKKGTNFAAPRINFHCSDNFPAKGISQKRAIIMWTTIPKERRLQQVIPSCL